jgi:hypothetical protein
MPGLDPDFHRSKAAGESPLFSFQLESVTSLTRAYGLQFLYVHVMFFIGIMSDYSYAPEYARKSRGRSDGASQVF